MPKPSAGIDQRGASGAAFDLGPRIDLELAFLPALFISHQHGNAVAIHAEQIGFRHGFGGDGGQIGLHPPR